MSAALLGFDTTASTLGLAHTAESMGQDFAILYAQAWKGWRPDALRQWRTVPDPRTPTGLLMGGLVFETRPTDYSYFSAARGAADGKVMVADMLALHFPQGQKIAGYWTADYPATAGEVRGDIAQYATEFRKPMEDSGYLPGAYIDGIGIFILKQEFGLIHYGWIPEATAWPGYETGKPYADIIQVRETHLLGMDVDINVIPSGSAGLW